MELITGATGYVGGTLLERLRAEGREVRALARDPARLPAGIEGARGDLVSGEGLEEALAGCDFAYYLVHSMERADDPDFAARDRLAAENFVTAAQAAGVKRVAYLGGFVPEGAPPSPHLHSRLEVEEILLEGLPESTALRASILIGARSSSFRVLVRLVEKMRVLPFPAWRGNRTQPIDERDAIAYLAATPSNKAAAGRSLDIAGQEVVSYAGMIERIADHMGVGRLPVRLSLTQTPAASAVVAKIAEQPVELVRPLMESLEHELLPRADANAADVYDVRLHSFDSAIERSLREWEAAEPLAAPMKVERDIEIDVPPEKVYGVLMDPRSLRRWVTIHQELEDAPEGDLRKGSTLRQQLKVAGQKFSVTWKVTETKKPERVVWEGKGPMKTKANIRYSLEETEAGNTRFSYFNEYELPGGALGKMASRAVSGAAAKETEKSLVKLKAFLERDG